MANIKLSFLGSENSGTNDIELQCFCTETGELYIELASENVYNPVFVCLDIPTAIKFAKTLRTEINKAKEVSDGTR